MLSEVPGMLHLLCGISTVTVLVSLKNVYTVIKLFF